LKNYTMKFIFLLGSFLSMQALGLRMHTSTSKAAILAELREEATRTIMASILGAEPDWSSFIEKSHKLQTTGEAQIPTYNTPIPFMITTNAPPPDLPNLKGFAIKVDLGASLPEVAKACRHVERLLRVSLNDTQIVTNTSTVNLVSTSEIAAANGVKQLLDETSDTKGGTVSFTDRLILQGAKIPIFRLLTPSLTVDVRRICNQLLHGAVIDVKATPQDLEGYTELGGEVMNWATQVAGGKLALWQQKFMNPTQLATAAATAERLAKEAAAAIASPP